MIGDISQNNNASGPRTHLLNETELAAYLRVSVAACRKWRFQGRGPEFVKLGSLVRYRREDVDNWLSSRPTGGEALKASQVVGGVQ